MDKKELSERDICTKLITPAVVTAGWDLQSQIREDVYFTRGKVMIRGNVSSRAEGKRADYILYYKGNMPIAIIEAKDNNHAVGAGLQQGLEYAGILDIPFVYSSNGDAFIEHDRTGKAAMIERQIGINEFPSPDELWRRYKEWKNITEKEERVITHGCYTALYRKPRYYQEIAINRTMEEIVKGKKRLLLVMATGTGKTYVASQIIYKLWKSGAKKRILFLADRNILVDQAKNNDFKVFGNAMTKITHRKVDHSYEIYLALYQGLSGEQDWKNIYREFSKDFFDLVIVDECHRGSAAEDSAWRDILSYFSSATQIGMTATPKETKDASNIEYFGEPVYTYSLKQGIDDGFLAPYKVIRISIDRDVEGWRPERGKVDKYGILVPDRTYNSKDFDRELILEERTQIVARRVTEFLKGSNDRFAKTIVFCVDIDHANRMAIALRNENADLVNENPKYVWQITGDDERYKRELDNFIDPASKYPVIVTTSELLTTGVDVQTCKLIVLDSAIQSMTKFKQIIGRGTRIREDYDKFFFTIMDFRQATKLFEDPDFDGEPVQVYEPPPGQTSLFKETKEAYGGRPDVQSQVYIRDGESKRRKYYVNGVEIQIINERVQYYDRDGKLITESLKDFTKKSIKGEFSSLNDFLQKWGHAERKTTIIEELRAHGLLVDELREEVKNGKEYDEFDLICHVAYDRRPLTRRERVQGIIKKDYFTRYGETAKKVIYALLDKYADSGVENIENIDILKVNPLRQFGTPMEIVTLFGGNNGYLQAIREVEQHLYPETNI